MDDLLDNLSDNLLDNGPAMRERDSVDVLDLAPRRTEAQPAISDSATSNLISNMAALVFSEQQQPDLILREFAARLMDQGHRVLGLVQKGHCEGPATRELFATLLHTGDDVQLFQDLGSCAQGCKLDVNQLLRAGASISDALAQNGADVLIINRFGKLEKEGKGLLFLIEQALGADVPILIAVPQASLDYWMGFSGGLGVRIDCDLMAVGQWWDRFAVPVQPAPLRRFA